VGIRGEVVRVAAIIIAFALWTVAACFVGYKLRDYRAAVGTQTAQTGARAARAEAVTEARNNDHGNAQTAAHAEQAHIDRTAAQSAHFDQLQQDIAAYAHTHPPLTANGCSRGVADAEFMRVWTEANAGAFRDATEHHDPAVADAGTEDAAPAAQR
jgi:hypothetical protein